jgi:hypothetical protein
MEHQAIHQYNEYCRLILITIEQLLQLNAQNWKYNRPPDEIRIEEIKKYIVRKDTNILQPFYIHYDTTTQTYEILDGIHRYTALKEINKQIPQYALAPTTSILSTLTVVGMEFEPQKRVNHKIVFVHLFIDLTEGSLIDIFQDLNKTVPVPNLYIACAPISIDADEKETIQEVTKVWQRKYKSHFSHSPSCNVPNINRDTFMNLLSNLYTKYKIRSKTKLEEILSLANGSIREYVESGVHSRAIPNKFSDKQKDKCKETGCYLFLYKEEMINFFIQSNRDARPASSIVLI